MRTLKSSVTFGEKGVQNHVQICSRITVNFIEVAGCWFSACIVDLGFKQKGTETTNYTLY